jgi:thiol-disulfide isomerase/thioredoxin
VLALQFHADWCGKCQAMGLAFQNLSKKYDTAPVLFHVFDQTEQADQRQARYMAHALDLASIWDDRGGSTGFILLVDADTHETINMLKHNQGDGQRPGAGHRAS